MTVKAEPADTAVQKLYRTLPSVNAILLGQAAQALLRSHSRTAVVCAIRFALDELREEIAAGKLPPETVPDRIARLPLAMEAILSRGEWYSLRRVINATGVLLHTNLGRAPLSRKALHHAVDVAGGYSNLEFDLDQGQRGKRDVHVEALLLSLLAGQAPSEAFCKSHRAVVVNNCAAATYLVLHALAKGKEVLVSRGELVEIGGGFRIPEILEASGALLREVGTTNRTRIADYERALSPGTALILRVHQSNFSMEGFVERPSLHELVALGARAGVPVFEDQGTGLLHSLETYGIVGESTLAQSIEAGCDLVAASGDKLLGGPQCGILAGKRNLVDQVRKHPLFRAFRVDKLTYAALEATLLQYRADAVDDIPVLRMLRTSAREIAGRCENLASALHHPDLAAEVVEVESVLGGGTTPKARLHSFAVSLRHAALSADGLLATLRRFDPPVIGRIDADRVLLDLRTVEPEYDSLLLDALNTLTETPD